MWGGVLADGHRLLSSGLPAENTGTIAVPRLPAAWCWPGVLTPQFGAVPSGVRTLAVSLRSPRIPFSSPAGGASCTPSAVLRAWRPAPPVLSCVVGDLRLHCPIAFGACAWGWTGLVLTSRHPAMTSRLPWKSWRSRGRSACCAAARRPEDPRCCGRPPFLGYLSPPTDGAVPPGTVLGSTFSFSAFLSMSPGTVLRLVPTACSRCTSLYVFHLSS